MAIPTLLGAVAAVIGSLLAFSPIMQARVIHRTRSSRDVSLGAMWIFAINCCAWLAYGISSGNVPVIIPNGIAICCSAVGITAASYYRRSALEPSTLTTEAAN